MYELNTQMCEYSEIEEANEDKKKPRKTILNVHKVLTT